MASSSFAMNNNKPEENGDDDDDDPVNCCCCCGVLVVKNAGLEGVTVKPSRGEMAAKNTRTEKSVAVKTAGEGWRVDLVMNMILYSRRVF